MTRKARPWGSYHHNGRVVSADEYVDVLERALERDDDDFDAWRKKCDQLEAENAKMRDLLQEMLGACCVYHSCDFQCQYSYRANLKEQCRLRDKARDLGIEVG